MPLYLPTIVTHYRTLEGAKVSVPPQTFLLHNFVPSLARYNLKASTSTFDGEWLFILGGADFKGILPEGLPSESKNTYSTMTANVTLQTPSVTPASGGSFAGAVVFLSVGSGRGTAYETFIAGSGYGEIARSSKTPFAALSGLVGISIYLPPELLNYKF